MIASKPWVPVETVQMTDGRLVDFSGKQMVQKSSWVDMAGAVAVRLDFRNGQTRTLALRDDMIAKYASYGAERKVSNEMTGVNDVDEAVRAVERLISRLDRGEWTKRRNAAIEEGR